MLQGTRTMRSVAYPSPFCKREMKIAVGRGWRRAISASAEEGALGKHGADAAGYGGSGVDYLGTTGDVLFY